MQFRLDAHPKIFYVSSMDDVIIRDYNNYFKQRTFIKLKKLKDIKWQITLCRLRKAARWQIILRSLREELPKLFRNISIRLQ